MSEKYIPLDRLIAYIKANGYVYANNLECMATADVAEVKHGEWIKPQFSLRCGFYEIKDFMCKLCLTEFAVEVEKGSDKMFYCPCCGAKMDGGKAE